ncbi:flagellar hook protein FlgE [Propionivibrio limicola]|uniref:flagellar hook protein FlgE n=1 Tax=Propionivibrio limicola TaxID=167645 RepID=UPI0012910D40|nr:flagellar hook protein FlgE [Propionivibrio limicola]
MAFQQGLSGLNASSKALDVVGNNVANSSTVGFKSSSAHFADVYAASLGGGGASQVGIGTALSSVFQQFTQGNITTTNNTLDVAINGSGYYVVSRDGTDAYTRNGQFHLDNEGYIVNDQDYKLLGYLPNASGVIDSSGERPEEIQISTANIEPQATWAGDVSDPKMVLNLDSSEDAIDSATYPTVDTTNPLSYNYSTSMTVYDSKGNDHKMTLYFVKSDSATSDSEEWSVSASLDGSDAVELEGTGSPLSFDSNGALPTTPAGVNVLTVPAATATLWEDSLSGATLGDGTSTTFSIDFSGTTNFNGDSTVNSMTQGGFATGTLTGTSISSDGTVLGNYSNGQSKALAQVSLATFANSNGLSNMGNNLWQATSTSGEAKYGVPGEGVRGMLQSAAVEESNVDLTAELVNMITLQRNYQASAQTIKTQDQIMQTLVNLR